MLDKLLVLFYLICFCFPRLLWSLMLPCFYLSFILTAVLFLFIMGVRSWLQMKRKTRRAQDKRPSVAFFHPYCNAGGGGERVLWCALRALQNRSDISAATNVDIAWCAEKAFRGFASGSHTKICFYSILLQTIHDMHIDFSINSIYCAAMILYLSSILS